VLPWVEANYKVRTDPGGRAIAGFSMGGKGALSLAGHRPDLFGAVAAIAGLMDLRDYATRYEIPDVYGPLAEHELRYAADSPVELAPNLKGLSITLLHGADDTYWVHYEQSRMMNQRLDALGYPHLWEEIPGQAHDPVSTYEITRTFERFAAAFDVPYSTPVAWRYRFADDTTRQVYDTTLTKTDPLTWTEVMSVTATGFDVASGDAFSLTTAPWYTPLANHVVIITNLLEGHSIVSHVTADEDGRLLLSLPTGRHRAAIAVQALAMPTPTATRTSTATPTATHTPTPMPTPTPTPDLAANTTERATLPDPRLTLASGWVYTNVIYLGETHDVNVYQPAGYSDGAPYPVVYLLHGHGQTPEMWRRADVESQADLYGTVIVAVEGDDSDIIASWYSRQTDLPWPDGPDWSESFYDWFFDGVLPWVEANYSVHTDPGGRAIAGFSMGGKGALSLAGHRPDLFVAVAGIAGVMDLRDYSTRFEIPDVYGPLAGNEIGYAADSPIELAPNLKGLSITLLHGAQDYLVNPEQSQRMSQRLDALGYPHLWEEIPGQAHEPVSTYEITRTFESLMAAFDAPYNPPVAWRYRLADDTTRQVYSTTLTKTDPLTWTEIMSVTATGFDTASGDGFSLTTASLYIPLADYVVTVTNVLEDSSVVSQVTADEEGRLSLGLPAGHHRAAISATALPERIYLPILFKQVWDWLNWPARKRLLSWTCPLICLMSLPVCQFSWQEH
jgi:S-formylglutathione hydrolase FrmB